METTALSPNFPNINLPECPSTVETGKFGMSSYEIVCSISISLTNPPKPVPNIIPTSGEKFVLSFRKLAV